MAITRTAKGTAQSKAANPSLTISEAENDLETPDTDIETRLATFENDTFTV